MPKADAVFEGGGVRGIAHAGALLEAEESFGYEWQNVAGTSAGAIVAALVAADYRASEIRDIIWSLDFRQLMDKAWEDRLGEVLLAPAKIIPRIGRVIPYLPSILKDFGVYEGNRFQELVQGFLAQKGKHVYGDLLMPGFEDDPKYRYRLRVIASDLTAGRMLVLPDDIRGFGTEPDELSIALSLRMSMSIPFFFEPVKLRNPDTGLTHIIVDGGILSNYPVWLFDAPPGQPVKWATLGFNIYEPKPKDDGPPDPFYSAPRNIANPIQLVEAIWSTVFSAMDQRYVSKRHWARTIPINAVGVKSTDFDLTGQKKQALLESGQLAARSFLSGFDFEEYRRTWRGAAITG
jgi:NTE family protein